MQSCKELLQRHHEIQMDRSAEKIIFLGVDESDVYNITAPFEMNHQRLIAGRVEPRESEKSEIYFFQQISVQDNTWGKIPETTSLLLQDPFVTFINEELIIGGVEIFPNKVDPNLWNWRTCFYRGNSIFKLRKFLQGPLGMKDIRLKQTDQGILVLTRPQGIIGGRGKIGMTRVRNLEDLTTEKIEHAPLLVDQFQDQEWGGANEIQFFDGENVGVLGHIACFDEDGNRHYYAMSFKIRLSDKTIVEEKILAERKDFLPGPAKRADLKDVVFSGGLYFSQKQTFLYAGTSDAEAQKIVINDPFE